MGIFKKIQNKLKNREYYCMFKIERKIIGDDKGVEKSYTVDPMGPILIVLICLTVILLFV